MDINFDFIQAFRWQGKVLHSTIRDANRDKII